MQRTKIKKNYKGYHFDGEADGPVNDRTFDKFAKEVIRYMEDLRLTTFRAVSVFHDYGTIEVLVSKLHDDVHFHN